MLVSTAAGGASAALTYGWLVASLALDRRIHLALEGRGVARPRLVMAAVAAAASAALSEADRRMDARSG
ncbi:hypothetical protein [Ruania alba]|uniref:hypothetical protein n=1 Tax=Ruania alba TaxID=648782 RepID=UPI000B7D8A6C|nr:hypothetical protein [Ruania alba]